jgi:hypothetical protein
VTPAASLHAMTLSRRASFNASGACISRVLRDNHALRAANHFPSGQVNGELNFVSNEPSGQKIPINRWYYVIILPRITSPESLRKPKAFSDRHERSWGNF